MKFKKLELEDDTGYPYIEYHGKLIPEESITCRWCKRFLNKEKSVFLCKTGMTFGCKNCEIESQIKISLSGEEYKAPKNNCPHIINYKSVMSQAESQILGKGYTLEHCHIRIIMDSNNESKDLNSQ